ncbi:hypothetical protein K439DRAFT_1271399, partial [Ramaria rubella]
SIVMRNIVSIKHRAGMENQADGLSRKWDEGQETSGEGEDIEITPDWEEEKEVWNDLFTIMTADEGNRKVHECFADDPYFADIAAWLTTLQTTTTLTTAESCQACQQSLEYMVDDRKLWRVGGKNTHQSVRVECITAAEGKDKAKACHEEGHWGRDLCEMQLHMTHFWPRMCRDVVEAI